MLIRINQEALGIFPKMQFVHDLSKQKRLHRKKENKI
jgi:hypothetical protein